jgi:gluconate 2-dehydrogenase
MDKRKVLVAREIPQDALQYLQEHCDVIEWDRSEKLTRDQLFELLSEAEGLLTSGNPIDQALLDHAPKLRIVSNISVGYNNFDLNEMKRRGVLGTNTPGVLDDSVADLIVTLMLSAARRVPELDRSVREGRWSKGMDQELFGIDVHHKTVGILGMGRIGEAVAKRLRFGFDMQVLYHNRRRNPDAEAQYEAKYVTMDELFSESDYVVVMTPLTPATEKLVGAREFGLMKQTGIFINVSRGQVIDEAALIAALQNKSIRAAGLDVFEREPVDPDNPLLQMDNTVVLPHIGSATQETRQDMAMLAVRNLVAGLQGRTPTNVVPELAE